MAIEVRTCARDEFAAFARPIWVAFGDEPDSTDEGLHRLGSLFEDGRMHAAFEDGVLVGSAGAFTFELTTPGRTVPAAGVTLVAVLPTHRRRGILRQLMRAQLDDVRERGEPVAILWASEERIYGRFGYGLASLRLEAEFDPRQAAFRADDPLRVRARLLDEEEAWRKIPPIYDTVRRHVPGLVSRSETWWRSRRLLDDPSQRRGAGALFRVVLEHEDDGVAYALYRMKMDFGRDFDVSVDVAEAIGVTPAATREIWRYLFSIDLAKKVKVARLPLDHPLLLMVDQPRKLYPRIRDALWCRLVDLPAALRARKYAGDGVAVLEVRDAFEPSNDGRWRVADGEARPTDEEPDLRLDVSELGSVYLGGFTFNDLVRAGVVEEARPGGAARADAIFGTAHPKPWNVEVF